MNRTRWFAPIYMASCAGSLAVALGINVLGNATGLFPSSRFPTTTERAWKTRRLDDAVRDHRPPQSIILGSSRVMQIQPKYVQAITGRTVFNYGVSGATPTDFLAQLRYLLKTGSRPELVILGMDEDAFNDGGRSADELLGHGGLFLEVPFPENARILGSIVRRCDPGTTGASLTRLLRRIPTVQHAIQDPNPEPRSSQSIEDAGIILLEDGYLIYCHHARARANGTLDLKAGIESRVQLYGAAIRAAILKPDPGSRRRFEAFLSLARVNRIEVRVMVTPFHPAFERVVFDEEVRQARHEVRQFVHETCARFGASFMDFSDLRSYEGDPDEFHDAVTVHPGHS
jgi:hypothetical protein